MNLWIDSPSKIVEEKMPPKGGTEILKQGLYNHTNILKHEDINIILSNPKYTTIDYNKKNILWQHLNYNDESLGLMKDPSYTALPKAFVYVSNWQYEKYRWYYNTPLDKSYVIKNSIEPIEFKSKPKDGKLKLIYTSTPFRGLDMLLEAFKMLNRDDVELDVYSSNIIYGTDYANFIGNAYDEHFRVAKETKNVNYMGYASNDEIKKALQKAHIFAYPCTFEETCCLAMVEAGAAGCRIVSTNLGALYETGSEYARLMTMESNTQKFIQNYANLLNEEIDNYWSISIQESLKEQSDFYNKYYSWERRAKEWNILFDKISPI